MRTLTPAERRAFRAQAHALHPFVSIGQHGLTPAVLHEIDVNLVAHELIKIRVFNDDRDERETLLARICGDLDAAPVQHLGKILTIWRPAPGLRPSPTLSRHGPTAGTGQDHRWRVNRRPARKRQAVALRSARKQSAPRGADRA